ncbi:MAG: hypothetical protein ACYC6G_03350 [Desulfobaccales bacterium]
MQNKNKYLNREIVTFAWLNSYAILYVFLIRNVLSGSENPGVFYVLFAKYEVLNFILIYIMLAVVYLTIKYELKLLASVQKEQSVLTLTKKVNLYLPIATFILTFIGTHIVFHTYPLAMDEYAPQFQAAIFAAGKLKAVVAQPWREFAPALQPIFTVYDHSSHSWHQGYLPVYAAIRSLFLKLGFASATNPFLAALSVIFIGLAARNIWPREKNAPLLAMLLLMSSSQFLITSMTGYSMPAHLLLNIVWIYCYTHKQDILGFLLPIIGVIALGVHNPFVHALFVAPFLLRILRERTWKFSLYVGVIYGLGVLFWYYYWKVIFPIPSLGIANNHVRIFAPPGLVQLLIIQPINLFLIISWQSVAITILSFLVIRKWRRISSLQRDLFWGCVLTFGFYFFFASDQGHGWGYRYIYGVLGNLILLAVAGWYELRETIGIEKAVNFLIVTLALGLFIQFPIRCVQAEAFTRPFAAGMHYLKSRPEPFILIDKNGIWYSQDFVRNDPFLRNPPKFFLSSKLSEEQLERLKKMGKVHKVEPEELVRFGLVRIEAPKTKDDQGRGAGP